MSDKTLSDIKQAIESLPFAGQENLLAWLRQFSDEEGDRIAEPVAAYGPVPARHYMSVDEYLAFEEDSSIRHEFVAGEVFAMSGTSLRHNCISLNLTQALRHHLRGSPCAAFCIDVKVHLHIDDDEFFYYPDVVVTCGLRTLERRQIDHPKLVVEVLSPASVRTDRWEKARNYQQLPSLEEYVLVAQDVREVTIHRRAEHWAPQVLTEPEAIAQFQSVDLTLPLTSIYDGVF